MYMLSQVSTVLKRIGTIRRGGARVTRSPAAAAAAVLSFGASSSKISNRLQHASSLSILSTARSHPRRCAWVAVDNHRRHYYDPSSSNDVPITIHPHRSCQQQQQQQQQRVLPLQQQHYRWYHSITATTTTTRKFSQQFPLQQLYSHNQHNYQHHYQQVRHYLYLPTSWTEFQLRLRDAWSRVETRTVRVKLLAPSLLLRRSTKNNNKTVPTAGDNNSSSSAETTDATFPSLNTSNEATTTSPTDATTSNTTTTTIVPGFASRQPGRFRTWMDKKTSNLLHLQQQDGTGSTEGKMKQKSRRVQEKMDAFWKRAAAGYYEAGYQQQRQRMKLRMMQYSYYYDNNNNHNNNNNATTSLSRLRLRLRWKIKPVQLTEYSEPTWFDAQGRPITSRDATGRFVNPWLSYSTAGIHSVTNILKWRWERFWREWQLHEGSVWKLALAKYQEITGQPTTTMTIPTMTTPPLDKAAAAAVEPPLAANVDPTNAAAAVAAAKDALKLTWIGHATCLIQQGDISILTDPMFSVKASPFQVGPIGPARILPPACTVPELLATKLASSDSHNNKKKTIDVVLISHDHYDHLDFQSCLALKDHVEWWVVPTGIKEWLVSKCEIDPTRIVELEWWESISLLPLQTTTSDSSSDNNNKSNKWSLGPIHSLVKTQDILHPAFLSTPSNAQEEESSTTSTMIDENRTAQSAAQNNEPSVQQQEQQQQQHGQPLWITCCPAQHWASRTFFDRNYRLWCSFAVFFPLQQQQQQQQSLQLMSSATTGTLSSPLYQTFYFAGDTALPQHFPLFEQIADYIGPVHLAAIPIGAYAPDYFMKDAHLHPVEAIKVHKALRAQKSVGIHWGTFALSEEPMEEPPLLLQQALKDERQQQQEQQMASVTNPATGAQTKKKKEWIDFVTIGHGECIQVVPPPRPLMAAALPVDLVPHHENDDDHDDEYSLDHYLEDELHDHDDEDDDMDEGVAFSAAERH